MAAAAAAAAVFASLWIWNFGAAAGAWSFMAIQSHRGTSYTKFSSSIFWGRLEGAALPFISPLLRSEVLMGIYKAVFRGLPFPDILARFCFGSRPRAAGGVHGAPAATAAPRRPRPPAAVSPPLLLCAALYSNFPSTALAARVLSARMLALLCMAATQSRGRGSPRQRFIVFTSHKRR